MKILVVDDDEITLTMLKYKFKELPYDFTYRAYGIDAIIEIASAYKFNDPFSVYVLDCALPYCDGVTIGQVIRLISKCYEKTVRPRIIAFTAYSGTIDHTGLLKRMGADAYLRKPEDVERISEVIIQQVKIFESARGN